MGKIKRRPVSAEEQEMLERLQVRRLTSRPDLHRCDQLLVEHHYLHDATLVGEHQRYVATYKGQWLAIATWSGAAFHLKAREAFIGWSAEQCRRRRALVANNSRLLVLPGCHGPNLLSRFMKLMLARLCADWQAQWGHPLALVETFVDPQLYQGTAYKVSGWCHLGRTAGWGREAGDFYQAHPTPKQLWVRELTKKACVHLRAAELPAAWAGVEAPAVGRCKTPVGRIHSLRELLRAEVPEFRRAQALAYPVAGMVCLMVMAMAAGVHLGADDLAQFADTLRQPQLRALGFRLERESQRVRCPKKTCFQRVLCGVDGAVLERVLLRWQEQLLGPPQDRWVVIDGKAMRHGGVEMVNATDGVGRYLGGVITPAKTNEVTAARTVLGQLALSGKMVLADAIHTNAPTAQQILYEQGADYLLTVKGNQPTLQATLQHLFEPQGFSPSTHAAHARVAAGAQPGTAGNPLPGAIGGHAQSSGLSRGAVGGAVGNPGQAQGKMDPRSGLSVEPCDAGAVAGARHAGA